jgi:hypothetical protein
MMKVLTRIQGLASLEAMCWGRTWGKKFKLKGKTMQGKEERLKEQLDGGSWQRWMTINQLCPEKDYRV